MDAAPRVTRLDHGPPLGATTRGQGEEPGSGACGGGSNRTASAVGRVARGPELTALFNPGPHPTLHTRDGFGGARGGQQVRTTPGPLCTTPSSCSSITPGSLGPRHEAPAEDSPCGSHRATARPGLERRKVAWTQAPHAL